MRRPPVRPSTPACSAPLPPAPPRGEPPAPRGPPRAAPRSLPRVPPDPCSSVPVVPAAPRGRTHPALPLRAHRAPSFVLWWRAGRGAAEDMRAARRQLQSRPTHGPHPRPPARPRGGARPLGCAVPQQPRASSPPRRWLGAWHPPHRLARAAVGGRALQGEGRDAKLHPTLPGPPRRPPGGTWDGCGHEALDSQPSFQGRVVGPWDKILFLSFSKPAVMPACWSTHWAHEQTQTDPCHRPLGGGME